MSGRGNENPAYAVLTVGALGLIVFILGGGVATGFEVPSPEALGWTTLGLSGLIAFIASVVGAYYSGRNK